MLKSRLHPDSNSATKRRINNKKGSSEREGKDETATGGRKYVHVWQGGKSAAAEILVPRLG